MPFTSEASTVVRLRCCLRQNRTHFFVTSESFHLIGGVPFFSFTGGAPRPPIVISIDGTTVVPPRHENPLSPYSRVSYSAAEYFFFRRR